MDPNCLANNQQVLICVVRFTSLCIVPQYVGPKKHFAEPKRNVLSFLHQILIWRAVLSTCGATLKPQTRYIPR
jgi:hypothetical protein